MKLSNLSYKELAIHDAWKVVEESFEEDELKLIPAKKNYLGQIEIDNGEVWCLCDAIFNDGSKHEASAMCRSDTNQSPLLWSFWNGKENVPLLLPPAPAFVIAKDGPAAFCKKFNRARGEVFPITLVVVPKFEFPPQDRMIKIEARG